MLKLSRRIRDKQFSYLIFPAIIVFAALWSMSLRRFVLDPDVWDESTVYLWKGITLSSWKSISDLNVGEGPLYSIFYAVLTLLEKDPLKLYFLMGRILCFLTPASVYIFCLRANFTRTSAFFASILVTLSPLTVVVNRWPSHFANLVLLLGFSLVIQYRSRFKFFLGSALVFGLTSFVRPELQLSFFACCFLAVEAAIRERWKPKVREIFALVGCALIASLWLKPETSEFSKSFYTFFDYTTRRYNGLMSPTVSKMDIMHRFFGDSRSVISALLYNPAEFFNHCLFYAKHSVEIVGSVFGAETYLVKSNFGRGFLALSSVFLLARFFRRKPIDLLTTKQICYSRVLFIFALVTIPTCIASLFFGTIPRYWMSPFSFLVITLCSFAVELSAGSLLALSSYLIFAMILIPPNFYEYKNVHKVFGIEGYTVGQRGIMSIVSYLRDLPMIEEKHILLSTEGYAVLVPKASFNYYCWNESEPCPVDRSAVDSTFESLKTTYFNFNIVMGSPSFVANIERSTEGRLKREWQDFLKAPERYGFKKLAVPCSQTLIYAKASALAPNFDESTLTRQATEVGCFHPPPP